jgi:hypothetical protein
MSRFWRPCLLVLIPFLFHGCAGKVEEGPKIIGSGKKETSVRELADFDKVELTTFGEIRISIGETFSVKIDIDDNLVDAVDSKVVDGKLIVTTNKRFTSGIGPIVNVVMPSLKLIDLPGRGSATFKGLKGDEITMNLTGAGSVTGQGEVNQVNVYHAGDGRVDIRKLEAKRAKVVLSGGGGASLKAEDYIEIDSSGSGTVAVHSTPKEVKKNVTGTGVVEVGEDVD